MLFLLLCVVFLLAYGVAAQSLLYPNAAPSFDILYDVVYHPYLSMYQDFHLEELEGIGSRALRCSATALISLHFRRLSSSVLSAKGRIQCIECEWSNVKMAHAWCSSQFFTSCWTRTHLYSWMQYIRVVQCESKKSPRGYLNFFIFFRNG